MRDKRKKFVDLAESRVNRAIKDIRLGHRLISA